MLVLYLIVFINYNVVYAAMYVGIAELWFVQHVQLCVTNAKLIRVARLAQKPTYIAA